MSDKHTYIIGEIGQNHNGSADLAKLLVEIAAREVKVDLEDVNLKVRGMDAVKLTKRDLKEELSHSAMSKPYNSPHSFGKTYGEHRAVLELTDEEHFEVYKHAKSLQLDFVETLCAKGCLSILKYFSPDALKVASRDLTNLPLLEALAETKIPIILSTGMAGKQELDEALDVIARHHSSISILHCVSEYPTRPENVNLRTITYLMKHYPQYRIGFSDHTIGIVTPVAAAAMGARIIEKHITIDRKMKGTDQAGSLGPDGIMRMMRDLRLLEIWYGEEDMFIEDSVQSARVKLERSIASVRPLMKGEIISEEDLHMLSPGDGFKWRDKKEVIGKKAMMDIPADEIIYANMIA
ncbi:MAG: N-acetylneuraminate synthase family protein [Crocinitomicaceae bacterium]|nr:N-acetylneuraminate synthase family protein [Crocinitomicaceae bacterium]